MFEALSDKVSHLAPDGFVNEDTAIRQLIAMSHMEGVLRVAGFPDLCPGKGGPVGAAMLSEALHPVFVGGDIGCGFSMFRLDLKPRRLANPVALLELMDGLDSPMPEPDRSVFLAGTGLSPSSYDEGMGTIGLGNHFIEVQKCYDVAEDAHGIEAGGAYLLVHSGSRAMGDAVFREVSSAHRALPLDPSSPGGKHWLNRHDECCRWASANRLAVANRVCEALDVSADLLIDLAHNMVVPVQRGAQTLWLHRKGAAPSDSGLSVLPGSRATPSYVVNPKPFGPVALGSIAHGAGRRLSRTAASNTTISASDLAVGKPLARGEPAPMVACGRKDLLAEERPEAYKDVRAVLNSMAQIGLCEQVAEMHPVATFKVSQGEGSPKGKLQGYRQSERARHVERERARSEKKRR